MLKNKYFHPKLLTTLKKYTFSQFIQDIGAGVVVGIIALPLAIAFGIASGVEPQAGIITAIIAGFLIALLGGSRVQIGGPTGAFIVVVYGIVQKFGIDGLIIASIMAGLILVLMGLFKIGDWIKFIPSPVTTGFTSGIAIVIFSSQVNDFLGLNIKKVPAEFIEKWEIYFQHFSNINMYAFGLAISTIVIMILMKKWPKIPSAFVALIITSVVSIIMKFPVETIGSRFGSFNGTLPTFVIPHVDMATIKMLIPVAFTIAILGAIESLLSAVVSDGLIGGKHRSNTELIAQGIANIITPFFGGIPATGAIARTATNIKNGGRTPIAGIVHAITLLLIFLFFGKFAELIPMATLAGILVVVSYNMSEWREFKILLSSPRYDVAVLLITFFLTVVFDLTLAIEVGLVLSSFLFVNRITDNTEINVLTLDSLKNNYDSYFNRPDSLENFELPRNVAVIEINGAFFFGAASKLFEILSKISHEKEIIILRMNRVLSIDATGLKILHNFFKEVEAANKKIILTDLNSQTSSFITHSKFFNKLDPNCLKSTINDALSDLKA